MEYDERIFGILNESYGYEDEYYDYDPDDTYDLMTTKDADAKGAEYIENGSNGPLDLSKSAIHEIPFGVDVVNGDLNLSGCRFLESLPDNFVVKGDLDISGCRDLNKLPTGLMVYGDINASRSGLTFVENGVTIRGSVNVENTPIENSWSDLVSKRPGLN